MELKAEVRAEDAEDAAVRVDVEARAREVEGKGRDGSQEVEADDAEDTEVGAKERAEEARANLEARHLAAPPGSVGSA